MFELRRVVSLALLTASGGLVLAQQASPAGTAQVSPGIPTALVPIHTRPDGQGLDPYGTWAAGPTYKVSFHEGLAFYLYGADVPEGEARKPWRWRTGSVRIGESELLGQDETPLPTLVGDRRFEYRFSNFVEVYDVRTQGVEQSFVIATRPQGADGDLIVRGVIETDLSTDPDARTEQHGGLEFTGADGSQQLSYGAAFAIDADGRRAAMTRALVGDSLTLRAPAAWMQTAKFPVTIDPMIAGPVFRTGRISGLRLRLEPYSGHRAMLMFSRDGDDYVYLCRPDLSDPRLIFSYLSESPYSNILDAAFVDAPRKWVVVYSRPVLLPGFQAALSVYFHDAGDTTSDSGSHLVDAYRTPSTMLEVMGGLGGTTPGAGGDRALLVFSTNPSAAGFLAAQIDARAQTWSSVGAVGPGRFAQGAEVAPSRGPTGPWLALLNYDFFGTRTYAATMIWPGGRTSSAFLPTGNYWSSNAVETSDGEYLVASGGSALQFWRARDNGDELGLESVEHSLDPDGGVNRLAWEPDSQHVGATYTAPGASVSQATRLSRGLCVIDKRPVTRFAFGMQHDRLGSRFAIGSYSSAHRYVRGFLYTHDPRVGSVEYGDACVGPIGATTPYAASDCTISLGEAPVSTNAVLMVSTLRRTTPIPGGCFEHIDPSAVVFSVPTRTSALGRASATIPLPDCPVFLGQLNAQWFVDGEEQVLTSAGLALYVLP